MQVSGFIIAEKIKKTNNNIFIVGNSACIFIYFYFRYWCSIKAISIKKWHEYVNF